MKLLQLQGILIESLTQCSITNENMMMTNCSIFAAEWFDLVEMLSVLDITKRASGMEIQTCSGGCQQNEDMFITKILETTLYMVAGTWMLPTLTFSRN